MSTLGTMITRISSELSRTDISADASAAIMTAVKYYEMERFFFNEARATLTTSAGQAEYPLPTDFQGIDNIVIQVNNYTYEIEEKPYTWIIAIDSNPNYLGRPYDYGIFAEMLRIYPKPIAAYPITMSYFKKFTVSSSLSASSTWFTEGEELIRTHAKVDLLESVIRGTEAYQEAQVLRNRITNRDGTGALDKLRAETSSRKTGNMLLPTSF